MRTKNDKRTRLVEAASRLFHEKGVSTTTLANIAELAQVPLGNVYYYFKSKDSIILAVLDQRRSFLKEIFSELEANHVDPKERLAAFISKGFGTPESVASHGDFLGSLCQELGKQPGTISDAAASLMKEILLWVQAQFSTIGYADADKRAVALLSNLQGINLLTLTFKDPEFISKQSSILVNEL